MFNNSDGLTKFWDTNHSNHPLYLKFRINGLKYLKIDKNHQKIDQNSRKRQNYKVFFQNKIKEPPQVTPPKNSLKTPQNAPKQSFCKGPPFVLQQFGFLEASLKQTKILTHGDVKIVIFITVIGLRFSQVPFDA